MEPTTPSLPDDDVAAIDRLGAIYKELSAELSKIIIGQQRVVELLSIALFSRGHALLMGVPGLAKTLLISSVAKTLDLSFNRIQFTPDLMPADITGTDIIQDDSAGGKRQFEFIKGPVFANIVLADEINRAPAKTQSALLEAMQERRVTVMGETHSLPQPFFVLATQNPIELEGTFPLPEAQLDRFLFKINVSRTPADVLARIVLNREMGVEPEIAPVLDAQELQDLMQMARNIAIPEVVADYIGRLVNATHPGESEASGGVKYGASPRAALGLAAAAKARALRHGRAFCSFEDVQAVLHPVLGHRILLNHMARLDGMTPATVIDRLMKEIPAQNKPLPDSLAAAKIH